jgi:hypothetical protein
MTNELEDRIRKRAYELWERDGAQHGKDQDHWHQAALEIEEEDRKASRKPKRGKADQSEAMKAAEAAARAHGFSLEEVAKDDEKPGKKKRAASTASVESPAPKKPGRPKKMGAASASDAPSKRKPGRPKKSEG